jgi:hypothetical protein
LAVQDQPSIEAQRLIAKRAYLRGLIRNNSTLITVMAGDLTIYVGRLPANKGALVRKDVNWFIANAEELGRRIEASFSRETENTTEKKYIRFRLSPPDNIPPEIKAEDDVNMSLKVIRDVLISMSENRDQLCNLGETDPSEGLLTHVWSLFQDISERIRKKLNLVEPPLSPRSQMGRVVQDILIVASLERAA